MTKVKTSARNSTKVVGPKTDFIIGTGTPPRKPRPAAAGHVTASTTTATEPMAPTVPQPPRQTKGALLRARLAEPGGVSVAALMQATGWQAHTLRSALSGLRKEGFLLTRRRQGDDTIYAIVPDKPVDDGLASGDGSDIPPVPRAETASAAIPIVGEDEANAAPVSLPTEADA